MEELKLFCKYKIF